MPDTCAADAFSSLAGWILTHRCCWCTNQFLRVSSHQIVCHTSRAGHCRTIARGRRPSLSRDYPACQGGEGVRQAPAVQQARGRAPAAGSSPGASLTAKVYSPFAAARMEEDTYALWAPLGTAEQVRAKAHCKHDKAAHASLGAAQLRRRGRCRPLTLSPSSRATPLRRSWHAPSLLGGLGRAEASWGWPPGRSLGCRGRK